MYYKIFFNKMGKTVVFGQAFGIGPKNEKHKRTPGKSNEALALSWLNILKQYPYAISYLQHEIVLACKRIENYKTPHKKPKILGDINGRFSTHELLMKMKSSIRADEIDTIIILAHSSHNIRVAYMVKKAFPDTAIIGETNDVPFDPKSLQWWTRNALLWWMKEVLVIHHHAILGWIDYRDLPKIYNEVIKNIVFKAPKQVS